MPRRGLRARCGRSDRRRARSVPGTPPEPVLRSPRVRLRDRGRSPRLRRAARSDTTDVREPQRHFAQQGPPGPRYGHSPYRSRPEPLPGSPLPPQTRWARRRRRARCWCGRAAPALLARSRVSPPGRGTAAGRPCSPRGRGRGWRPAGPPLLPPTSPPCRRTPIRRCRRRPWPGRAGLWVRPWFLLTVRRTLSTLAPRPGAAEGRSGQGRWTIRPSPPPTRTSEGGDAGSTPSSRSGPSKEARP
ncbi:hypothetical protein ACVWXU_008072 [Streptomyces sp. TE33382]